MGVDEAQAFETAPGTPLPGELRNEEALGISHDDVGDRAGPIHQDSYLAVYFPGDFGQLPGQLRGDQFTRRYLAAVEPLQPLGLLSF